nr:MAG TPA: hypothetical protein [Caudoviricetes sp.]
MKIYYGYVNQELLTEQEAREYTEQDVREDKYGIWEFIIDHYSHSEIIEKLPPDFIEEIIKTITENQLENENLFCVRDF